MVSATLVADPCCRACAIGTPIQAQLTMPTANQDVNALNVTP